MLYNKKVKLIGLRRKEGIKPSFARHVCNGCWPWFNTWPC